MANQNVTQLTQQTVSANPTSLFYAVTGSTTDTGLPLSVFVNNLGLTGVPTVPTAAPGTNTTQIASTAFVQALNTASLAAYAPLAGATFTGDVTIAEPSAALLMNDTSGTGFAQFVYRNAGVNTWIVFNQSSSNMFAVNRYVSGSFVDTPFTISNTTGLVTMTDGVVNTPIGAAGASTGAFTNLSSSGTLSGTGFTNYFASPPAIGATAPATGKFTTLTATGLITPATTSGIKGTTLADNATAGSVGEVLTATATGVAQTSTVLVNVTSLALTAGDWDVTCSWTGSPATTFTGINFGLTTTTAGQAPVGQRVLMSVTGAGGFELTGPTVRFNVSSGTTVFLTSAPSFTGSSTSGGTIFARRRR